MAGLDTIIMSLYKRIFSLPVKATFKNSMADLERESIGYYIRDELSILRNLILSAGYRYERTKIEGTLNDVRAWQLIVKNIHLTILRSWDHLALGQKI